MNKSDLIGSYVLAQQKLQQEKVQIEARLRAIDAALGQAVAAPVVRRGRPGRPARMMRRSVIALPAAPVAKAAAPRKGKRKRTMSAEARARIAAATKARWAKIKASGEKKL
jgi:hypothetical protein